jgi:hypothetical protein
LVPRRALRLHPGVEVSLAFSLNPAPHGVRFGVRAVPAVPTRVFRFNPRFNPGGLESACASYPARRPAYRSAWRVATSSPTCPARVVRLPPLRASGCARAVLRYFPQVHCRLTIIMCRSSAGSSRFPSESSPYGFDPAVRNPLPSPRASSHFRDLSEPR